MPSVTGSSEDPIVDQNFSRGKDGAPSIQGSTGGAYHRWARHEFDNLDPNSQRDLLPGREPASRRGTATTFKMPETGNLQYAWKLDSVGTLVQPGAAGRQHRATPSNVQEEMSEPQVSKDLLDAKLETIKVQNDGRFNEVLAEIRVLSAKIDQVPTTRTMIITTLAGIAGAAGLFLGILSYSGDRFDGGIAAQSLVEAALTEQAEQNSDRDDQIQNTLARLDEFLAAQSTPSANAEGDTRP